MKKSLNWIQLNNNEWLLVCVGTIKHITIADENALAAQNINVQKESGSISGPSYSWESYRFWKHDGLTEADKLLVETIINKNDSEETTTISELCVKIDSILKTQNITSDTYKQLNMLLHDIVCVHNKKVGYIDDILKQTYLDIANNYDVSDLSHKSDIVATVASTFREKVHNQIH